VWLSIAILVPLPAIDEIVGKWRFDAVCAANADLYVAPRSSGKTVQLGEISDKVRIDLFKMSSIQTFTTN
jgi:hypothetical protein